MSPIDLARTILAMRETSTQPDGDIDRLAEAVIAQAAQIEALTNGHANAVRYIDERRVAIETLRMALREALDIAAYEAAEYQGKREHLVRIPELRKTANEVV
jgi:hypothetical protein